MLAPILTLVWIAFILVAACTSDAHAFLYHHVVHLRFVSNPSLSDLFIVHDFRLSEFFLIQKIGHMISFGILYLLVFRWVWKERVAIVLCVLVAFSTEVLQLHFGRNGRFYDVGIDLVGILVACGVYKFVVRKRGIFEE